MSVNSVREVSIPSATPLVYTFEARECSSGRGAYLTPLGEPTGLGMTGRFIATKEVLQMSLGINPVATTVQTSSSHYINA